MTTGVTFEEIAENFEFLDDWEERYRYVIELGRALPVLDDARRGPATKVEGCASQVWLVPEVRVDDTGVERLFFQGDSDAMIVRGLIAILTALISGRTVAEIVDMDIAAELDQLQFKQALSAQRSNGLSAMVGRIRDIAGAARAA